MYLLEEKLNAKYNNGRTVFSAEFFERVRELDQLRSAAGHVEQYPGSPGRESNASE
jgi:hypothetical protein